MLQLLEKSTVTWNGDFMKQFCCLITNNTVSHEEMMKLHLYSSFSVPFIPKDFDTLYKIYIWYAYEYKKKKKKHTGTEITLTSTANQSICLTVHINIVL